MRLRFSPWIAIPSSILVACAFSAPLKQTPVTLRRALVEGAKQTYHLEYSSSQNVELPNGMGDQEVTVNGSQDLLETVGKVDAANQSAAYELKSTNIKMDIKTPMGNPLEGKEMPKETVMTGQIDSRNRATNLKGDAKAMEMTGGDLGSSSSMNVSAEFPEGPIKIGDTWETQFPKMPFSPGGKMKSSLTGEKSVGTVSAWVITITGTVPLAMDMTKAMDKMDSPIPKGGITVKGTVDLNTEVLVDKATGLVLSVSTKAKSKAIMSIESMSADLNISGESTSNLKRSDVK